MKVYNQILNILLFILSLKTILILFILISRMKMTMLSIVEVTNFQKTLPIEWFLLFQVLEFNIIWTEENVEFVETPGISGQGNGD